MGKAVRLLNDYDIKMIATTKKEVDYDNFYEEDLVRMVTFLNKEYNKLKEQFEAIKYEVKLEKESDK